MSNMIVICISFSFKIDAVNQNDLNKEKIQIFDQFQKNSFGYLVPLEIRLRKNEYLHFSMLNHFTKMVHHTKIAHLLAIFA